MKQAWTTIHIAAGVFGMVMAMACVGIIIQEEQRKQRAREAQVEADIERRERLLHRSGRGVS
jgi:hypothetical protein